MTAVSQWKAVREERDALLIALNKITDCAERTAESLRYVGPPGHCNYISKTSAADRLDAVAEFARAELAKVGS